MKVMTIIPTYNEKENIERLVPEILQLGEEYEVLIIDDNSPDGTGNVAEALKEGNPKVHVIHRPKKLGLGSAYIEGFRYALSKEADFIFEMDADFSHDPKYIPQFMEAIKDADMVTGSRYIQGISIVNWPLSRLLLSLSGGLYARTITGLKIKDCTSGFKCFRRNVLESLDLSGIHSDGYAFHIEINYKCQKKGFRLKEIPIIFIERRIGKSKLSKRIIWEAIFIVWRLKWESIINSLRTFLKRKNV